jgi:hypothetical protein
MARACGASFIASLIILCPTPALAHAGERGQVLLLPTELYITGGALAVLLSVIVLALGPRKPGHPRTMALALAVPIWLPIALSTASFVLVVLLGLAGLFGNPDPLSNPLPPALWTLWWVGLTALTVLFGNLWRLLNPWIGPYRLLIRKSSPPFAYPESFGSLPALVLFFLFAWFELVYPAPQDPARLATIVLVYLPLTFLGLFLFGPIWLERGEAFTLFFAMVAKVSPLQCTDRNRLMLTLPGSALTYSPPLSPSGIAFVLLALSTVSFDGLSRTFAWAGLLGVNPLEYPGRSALVVSNTIGLVLTYMVLSAGYIAVLALGKTLSLKILGHHVLSLVPIAVGFHLAHYLPNLLLDWRHALHALADPFRLGWDLFQASSIRVSSSMAYGHATVTLIYRIQVAVIVLAHVMAVFAAHRLARVEPRQSSLPGQVPVILFMIAYTVFGLWLLSTPVIG